MSVYVVEGFDMLLLLAKRLTETGYSSDSALYYDDEQLRYYIFLDENIGKDSRYAFMTEYSKGIKLTAGLYVREHHKCVLKKDAIKSLLRLI